MSKYSHLSNIVIASHILISYLSKLYDKGRRDAGAPRGPHERGRGRSAARLAEGHS